MKPLVTVAILARNKEHTLPDYLECVERLDYPKSRIRLDVRTNDNSDNTEAVLTAWLDRVRSLYVSVDFERADPSGPEVAETDRPHDWSASRLKRLGRIRQQTLEAAVERGDDYYFVADCDNFVPPWTLSDLIAAKKPFIAPMLDALPNRSDLYSNFFAACDEGGYYANDPRYLPIRQRAVRGTFEVPVAHCTYLIDCAELRARDQCLSYVDDTERHEFVIVSESARRIGFAQYVKNDRFYGYLVHHLGAAESVTLQEEARVYAEQCRPAVRALIEQPDAPPQRLGEEVFHGWYASGGEGSGPGSSAAYTARFREFLETFMHDRGVRTVVDYGCGDWQWAKLVKWGDRRYHGFDIVESLVDKLRAAYGRDDRAFTHVADPESFVPPECDLLICKDVLQHLPTEEAISLVRRFEARAKHLLWVNDRSPNPAANNAECVRGGYRYLDLSRPPFSLDGAVAFEFGFQPNNKVAFWQRGERDDSLPEDLGAGWGTHLPVLAAIVAVARPGPVLELGAGHYSTPLLHAMCRASGTRLVTIDSDPRWLKKFRSLATLGHHMCSRSAYAFADEDWSVALVDNAMGERSGDIIALAERAQFVVVHDSNFPELYGYEEAFAKFKYRADYRRMHPHTAVLSNFRAPPADL